MTISDFGDHKLIFLGTGGGRIHCSTQYRRTGGIIYYFNGAQAHIDPGPGAIVYLNQMNIDRLKTKWVIVTHAHTDHCNDVPVIIESLHETLKKKAGTLITTNQYLNSLDEYYIRLMEQVIVMKNGKKFKLTNITEIQGTKVMHGKTEGFGLIFTQNSMKNPQGQYKIAFTSDTEIFNGFAEQFDGVDILVANVLRPNDRHCPRHACVDEIIPTICAIHPKIFIMTHFGAYMDSKYSKKDLVPDQVKKIKNSVPQDIKVIGAKDGMQIEIAKQL
ncbi:MAG: MBL fold metallo-hydrolase [Candidatus Lokiarchaeota archaeon]|nr:MBL fold metallo-hydrolase [Candidatus Lokiarchaeota archaeon]